MFEFEYKHGIAERIVYSKEEAAEFAQMKKDGIPLPDDVFYDEVVDSESGVSENKYFRITDAGISQNEKDELIQLKQLSALREIRSWVRFFGILTIIGLILGVIFAIVFLSRSCA